MLTDMSVAEKIKPLAGAGDNAEIDAAFSLSGLEKVGLTLLSFSSRAVNSPVMPVDRH